MKQHSGNAISGSVIGGADGPTSIFVAGPGEKRALKARIRDSIYRYKRKRAEKRIVAAPHSLAETVQYAKDKYGLTEAAATDSDYIEQMRCLKENLVLRQKPELLGSLGELPEPDQENSRGLVPLLRRQRSGYTKSFCQVHGTGQRVVFVTAAGRRLKNSKNAV